ncbi:MAG: hypothetical protein AAFX87_21645 [Bacteroidota bacterium]
MTRLILTFTLLAIFATSNGFCQSDNGYVVTLKNDTIRGRLKNFGEIKSCNKVDLVDNKKARRKYKPKHLKAYQIDNSIYVTQRAERPLKLGSALVFMKLVVDGDVRLFRYHYFAQTGGAGPNQPSISTPEIDYYLERDGKLTLVRSLGFKKSMSIYFRDNRELIKLIQNKDLKYRNMEEIVRIYNEGR